MNENRQGRRPIPAFTSRLSRGECFAVLAYLPVHILILPTLLVVFYAKGYIDEAQMNFLCYAVGAVYMIAAAFRFLRRDFDPLCDRLWSCVIEILSSYVFMLALNMVVSMLVGLVVPTQGNPNNSSVMELYGEDYGMISAMIIFLAPIPEELMFRAGIFGTIRQHNRTAAYIVSILAFSLYHVWNYALTRPIYLLYMIQYIPVSYLLCRCYERTNSIWTSIFFHMFTNGLALRALSAIQEML